MNEFYKIYNDIYNGWNKLISTLYSIESNTQFENYKEMANKFSDMCDHNTLIMKKRILNSVFNIKLRYKEYKIIINLIKIMTIEFEKELNYFYDKFSPAENSLKTSRIIIKGFRKYDE